MKSDATAAECVPKCWITASTPSAEATERSTLRIQFENRTSVVVNTTLIRQPPLQCRPSESTPTREHTPLRRGSSSVLQEAPASVTGGTGVSPATPPTGDGRCRCGCSRAAHRDRPVVGRLAARVVPAGAHLLPRGRRSRVGRAAVHRVMRQSRGESRTPPEGAWQRSPLQYRRSPSPRPIRASASAAGPAI